LNRNKRIYVLAGTMGLVIFGYGLSQGSIAVPRRTQPGMNISGQETEGTVTARPAAPQAYIEGAGMGSTINIPANAFVPSEPDLSYSLDYSWGYLRGGGPGQTSMGAPVIFPKGAKKILHVDFWVLDVGTSGLSASFRMSSQLLGSLAEPSDFFSFNTSNHGGTIYHYIKKPAQGAVWSIFPNRIYYIHAGLNKDVNFYGAVVYYQ
jgi:hypothetical protein